jgi:cytidylate kinase
MSIVTLTGHLGSMGEVARLVAQSLGYRLADRELVLEAAAALGWSAEEVQDFDERTGGLGRRMIEFLERYALQQTYAENTIGAFAMSYGQASQQLLTSGDRYIEALRAVIQALADEGDVVIVGRGGQAMLAHHPEAVHVRVACAPEERVRRIARRDQIDFESAQRRVAKSDEQREDWHRKYFNIDYQAPYHYALVVNTGVFSDAFAARLIVELVQSRVHRVPPRGRPPQRNGHLRVIPEAAPGPI